MQKGLYLRCLVLTGFAFFSFSTLLPGQSGCPGCTISLPPLPADTIYLGAAPDGVAGQYYDGDISFRMPRTTTPVNAMDPSTPAGLTINNVTIVSLLNVPPGLDWEPSKFSFDTQSQTDGCVKFCGTPLQPGLYEVQVYVTAQVLLVTQSTSFSFPIYIAPAASNNDGFAMQNNTGCGEVTVSFENNVPANGNSGYSYFWDFGNGHTSTEQNPGAQTYSTPGIYDVNFKATIDTFGYKLTTVRVMNSPCTDFGIPPIFSTSPDLYVKIKDPNGNLIVTTPVIDNATYPAVFNINLMLGEGIYELEVRDEDSFGSESCGYVYFNKNTTNLLISGDLQVFTDIIHPVTTIESADSVIVFPLPDPPLVSPQGQVNICTGSEVELELSNYFENIQWYRDTVLLFGETGSGLSVSEPGGYWVQYTSPDGCKSQSEPVVVGLISLPLAPAFYAIGNELTLVDPSILPADYSLQWYQEGELIPGATGETYCFTEPGVYLFTLQVTDNTTGCSNDFSLGASFNPNYNCAISSAEEPDALASSLRIFPNPTTGWVGVSFEKQQPGSVDLALFDALGQVVWQVQEKTAALIFQKELDLSTVPAGLYFLKIQTADGVISGKIMRQ